MCRRGTGVGGRWEGGGVRGCRGGGGCEMNWRSNVAECQRLYSETEAKTGGGDGGGGGGGSGGGGGGGGYM